MICGLKAAFMFSWKEFRDELHVWQFISRTQLITFFDVQDQLILDQCDFICMQQSLCAMFATKPALQGSVHG